MLADHHRQVNRVVDGRSGVVLLSLSCYNIGIGSTYRQEGETCLDGSNCARPTGINSDRVVPGPIGNHRLCHTVEVEKGCAGNPGVARNGVRRNGRSGVVLLSLSCYNIGIGSTFRQEGETCLEGSNWARPTEGNSDRVVPGPIGNHRLKNTVHVEKGCAGNPGVTRNGVRHTTYCKIGPKTFCPDNASVVNA